MSDFEAVDAGYADRVRASFSKQAFMTLIKARMPVVAPGNTEIELPFWDGITQQHGFIHGGVVGAIADSAAGYAARTLMDADSAVLTVEYKINFLSPSIGEKLVARGRVIKPGRQIFVCAADVIAISDGTEKQVAAGQYTMACLKNRPDLAGAGTPDDARGGR